MFTNTHPFQRKLKTSNDVNCVIIVTVIFTHTLRSWHPRLWQAYSNRLGWEDWRCDSTICLPHSSDGRHHLPNRNSWTICVCTPLPWKFAAWHTRWMQSASFSVLQMKYILTWQRGVAGSWGHWQLKLSSFNLL